VKCVFGGALVTAIVQSSSATVAITMTLAASGVIDYQIAVALVLGENIGTTITAFLASLGASTNAKRVAYAHILIKVIGVMLMSFVFFWYIDLLETILSNDLDIKKRIAFSHTLFNIFIVCLFLPLRDYLARFLIKFFPDKPQKESPRLTHLDVRMLDTPMMVIEQSRKEILQMGEYVHRMFEYLNDIINSEETDDALVKKIFHREEILDNIQKEISTFLVGILSGDVPHDIVIEARAQIRMADEYESVSDYITNILKLYLKLKKADISLTEKKQRDLLELHERTAYYFSFVDGAIASRNVELLPRATIEADAISHQFREFRSIHLQRLTENKVDPLLTVSFMNMINAYRRIRDHILNIAEAFAGKK
jgi:phosphate:Na+ symporter